MPSQPALPHVEIALPSVSGRLRRLPPARDDPVERIGPSEASIATAVPCSRASFPAACRCDGYSTLPAAPELVAARNVHRTRSMRHRRSRCSRCYPCALSATHTRRSATVRIDEAESRISCTPAGFQHRIMRPPSRTRNDARGGAFAGVTSQQAYTPPCFDERQVPWRNTSARAFDTRPFPYPMPKTPSYLPSPLVPMWEPTTPSPRGSSFSPE